MSPGRRPATRTTILLWHTFTPVPAPHQGSMRVSGSADAANFEFNRAFVTMQYFCYLRRDADTAGFNFWLNKLNSFGGNFTNAEMVKAFITSAEYRQRFGAS